MWTSSYSKSLIIDVIRDRLLACFPDMYYSLLHTVDGSAAGWRGRPHRFLLKLNIHHGSQSAILQENKEVLVWKTACGHLTRWWQEIPFSLCCWRSRPFVWFFREINFSYQGISAGCFWYFFHAVWKNNRLYLCPCLCICVPVCFLGAWTFLWFVCFCLLASQWGRTHDVRGIPQDAARATVAFSFFSIATWVSSFFFY